jgi:T5SS/PEP-CTERM-associated repeat protein
MNTNTNSNGGGVRSGRALALALLAGGVASLGASPARAVVVAWANAAGGSAGVASNWNPAQVPTASDVMNFSLAGTYSVTFPVSVSNSLSQNHVAGTVTVVYATPHTIASQLTVGINTGSNATLTVPSGQVTAGGVVAVGNTNATGVLNVTFDGRVHCTGASGVRVGNGGVGTLNLLSGGEVQSTGPVVVGSFAGGNGTLNVIGQGSDGIGSRLVTLNTTTGDLTIGGAANGNCTVNSAGLVQLASDLVVGPTAGFTGSLTVGGTGVGSAVSARTMSIGSNSTAAAAGTGTVTINPGAQVEVSGAALGQTVVGDPDGGTGTLNLAGGLLSTRTLEVDPSNGTFNHTGGELRITAGGTYSTTAGPLNLSGTAGNPEVLRYQGATGTLTNGVVVGGTGFGELHVEAGSVVTAAVSIPSLASFKVGAQSGSSGLVVVTGPGSRLLLTGGLGAIVGNDASGALRVSNGGVVTASSVDAGRNIGGVGTVELSGGATMQLADMSVGRLASAGVASLTMSGSSSIVTSTFDVNALSTVSIDDSTVSSTVARVEGVVTLSNGGELGCTSGLRVFGTLRGGGNAYGNVTIEPGGRVEAQGGALFVGSISNGNNGLTNLGTLDVGAEQVFVQDGNGIPAGGDYEVAGGQLFASGLTLGSGDTLSGFGGITAPVSVGSGAVVEASGGNLVFNAPVTAVAGATWAFGQNGNTVVFAAGGGFTGQGALALSVRSEEEATITASGPLDVGNSAATGAVNLQGPLAIGAHTVRLFSRSAAMLGVETTIAGGVLDGPADVSRTVTQGFPPFPVQTFTVFDKVPIWVLGGAQLVGHGTINHELLTFDGSLVRATGPLSIQSSSIPPFFEPTPQGDRVVEWFGDLEVGAHSVTFQGSVHRFQSSSTVTMAGGRIDGASIQSLGTLVGHGSIGASLRNAGTLSPGGTGIGEITVESGFSNLVNSLISFIPGRLEVDLSGDQGFVHDRILVSSGDAALAGTLVLRVVDAGPSPDAVYPIIVCQAGEVLGTFDVVEGPTLPRGALHVRYGANTVEAFLCLADFDKSGSLNPDDLADFIAAFFTAPPPPEADFDLSGQVNPDDLADFIAAFFGGCS